MGELLVLPPQNCYLFKCFKRKKEFMFFLKKKVKMKGIFVGSPASQNYYPLNPKHHNEKGIMFFPPNHHFDTFKVTINLFVDSVVCC